MYRKIEQKIWSDSKFLSLSPLPPSGQSLWLYLLTGPHNTSIPGLFRIGQAAMAEELNWSVEQLSKPFQELFQKGLAKADWGNKLVWLPNAFKHNRPANPNVIKSWGSMWDFLPECDLKIEAYNALRNNVKPLGEGFLAAFDSVIDQPDWNGSLNGYGNGSLNGMRNQEQEQEQEQEQYQEINQDKNTLSVKTDPDPKVKNSNKSKRPKFTAPSVQEVSEYCKEKSYTLDPEQFCDYHEARGWVLSGGKKMQCWKAALRTWAKNENKWSVGNPRFQNSANNQTASRLMEM